MKTIITFSLLFSFSAIADFSDEHVSLCTSSEVQKLVGKNGNCLLVLAPTNVVEVSRTCEGKLSDITCRVMMLKTSDSASMNLICGEAESPLVTQVLPAEVLSYNVSAVVATSSGKTVIINDPQEYHFLSNPALDVQLSLGEKTKAKMVLTLQDRSIELTNVTCE